MKTLCFLSILLLGTTALVIADAYCGASPGAPCPGPCEEVCFVSAPSTGSVQCTAYYFTAHCKSYDSQGNLIEHKMAGQGCFSTCGM